MSTGEGNGNPSWKSSVQETKAANSPSKMTPPHRNLPARQLRSTPNLADEMVKAVETITDAPFPKKEIIQVVLPSFIPKNVQKPTRDMIVEELFIDRLKFPRSSKIAHTIPLEQEANHIGYIVRKTAIPNLRECTIDGYAPWTKQNVTSSYTRYCELDDLGALGRTFQAKSQLIKSRSTYVLVFNTSKNPRIEGFHRVIFTIHNRVEYLINSTKADFSSLTSDIFILFSWPGGPEPELIQHASSRTIKTNQKDYYVMFLDENISQQNVADEEHLDNQSEAMEPDDLEPILTDSHASPFHHVSGSYKPHDIKLDVCHITYPKRVQSIRMKPTRSPKKVVVRAPRKRKQKTLDGPEISARAAISLMATNPAVVKNVSIFKNREGLMFCIEFNFLQDEVCLPFEEVERFNPEVALKYAKIQLTAIL